MIEQGVKLVSEQIITHNRGFHIPCELLSIHTWYIRQDGVEHPEALVAGEQIELLQQNLDDAKEEGEVKRLLERSLAGSSHGRDQADKNLEDGADGLDVIDAKSEDSVCTLSCRV